MSTHRTDFNELRGLLETLDILRDPVTMEAIAQGEQELREGKYVTYEEVFGESPVETLTAMNESGSSDRKI